MGCGMFSGSEDWKKEGITLAPTTTVDPHAPSLAEFSAAFSVVFVDPTGYVNLVSDMNRGVFDQVSTGCASSQTVENNSGYFCSLGPHLEKTITMFTYDDQTLHGVSTIPVLRVYTCRMIHK